MSSGPLGGQSGMDLTQLVKKLVLPHGVAAPARLTHGSLVATTLDRSHLDDDVRGINASIELIQRTRGGDWPTEPVSADFDLVDLVWHEQEFREGTSFSYAVHDTQGQYVGCCYLYPLGRRTELTPELLAYDVDVSWWVTPDAYEAGHYAGLYEALQHWLGGAFPFWRPFYSNREIPAG